jgi:hypothetical protein
MNVPLLSPGQAVGLDVLLLLSALASGSLLVWPMRLWAPKRCRLGAVPVQSRRRVAGTLRR